MHSYIIIGESLIIILILSADVMKLVDIPDLGSGAKAWGFDSLRLQNIINNK